MLYRTAFPNGWRDAALHIDRPQHISFCEVVLAWMSLRLGKANGDLASAWAPPCLEVKYGYLPSVSDGQAAWFVTTDGMAAWFARLAPRSGPPRETALAMREEE